MEDIVDIILRSVEVQLVDSKKRDITKTNELLLFTFLLLNSPSKYKNQKIPQINVLWDFENLSLGMGLV